MDNEKAWNHPNSPKDHGSLYRWEVTHYVFVETLDSQKIDEILKSDPNPKITHATKNQLKIVISEKVKDKNDTLSNKFLLVIHDEPTIKGIIKHLTV